jgi:hypothetical protein
MRKIKFLSILSLFLVISGIVSAQTTRTVAYGKMNQNITLDLNWDGSNYGTVQWQKSTDNGQTWTDIDGATASSYTYRVVGDALYRAHVVGDPACPPINLEREIKVLNFNVTLTKTDFNSAEFQISMANFKDADIIEYGYAENFSVLARKYDMMPLTKVGDTPPEGDFSITCTGLRPSTAYSIRFYVKTADGSIVFGPGKLINTRAGIEFSSEDWVIGTNRLRAQFMLSGTATVSDVACSYGETADNMKPLTVSNLGSGKYCSSYMTGLKPATPYYIKISAVVDGVRQEQTRVVPTMTDYSTYTVDNTVKPVSHRIMWNSPRKLTPISAETMAATEYPRICRVDDTTLLLTYHGGTTADWWLNSYYRLSYDNGATWEPQVMIFDKSKSFLGSGYYRICNPQATLLDNGWVILSATANGNPETNENCKTICIISKDKCRTWSDPIIVGRGRGWEPHVVQLPGGELELLVSSEKPWWRNPSANFMDQEIVYARSTDYGQTWTALKPASYLSGGRDGMPVPVVMQGNKGVLYTIESPSGGVRPSVVHRNLNEEWDQAPWDRVNDSRRWASGLNVGGGAPYCVQLPTGEIVMLCHTNQAGSVWQTCRPQVQLTDNTGHNPRYTTLPCTTGYPLSANEGAYYNSLFVKDSEHIWLLVTRVTYNGTSRGKSTIEYMEGQIIPVN